MEQRRIDFEWRWALGSAAIGIIVVSAFAIGAGRRPSVEFLVSGAIMGLCIYTANEILHGLLGCYINLLRRPISTIARIFLNAAGGVIGWMVAFVLASLIFGGKVTFSAALRREVRWLLLITIAITILVGVLIHAYEELRRRLSTSIEQLKAREYADKELEVARSIQSRLLPPPLIEGEGFTITARNLPANFVAGDFYDVLRLDDGSVGIIVADVSGKGLGASLIMASVKAMLPFVANGSVAETLRTLNARLSTQLGRREFVAMAYARFQPASGTLRIANAGMPDPYIIAAGVVTSISVTGERLPLGVRDDIQYDSAEVPLRPGDRVLLFSDGIPEAHRVTDEPLGYDGLRETIMSIKADGNRWIDTLLERVRAQVRGVDDDWTAVVLERHL